MHYITPKCKKRKTSNPHTAGLFPKADLDQNEVKTYSDEHGRFKNSMLS